jgi:hypothetical protein
MNRYIIRMHDESFAVVGRWTGETISHHNTWQSATKAAFILEKQSRDQVEAPEATPLL